MPNLTDHPRQRVRRASHFPTWFPLLAACVLMCLFAEVAVACPTCKDSVAGSDPQSQSMAAGYFYSILFMMSMPFLILGTFGSVAYRAIRRARDGGAGEGTLLSSHSTPNGSRSTAAGT